MVEWFGERAMMKGVQFGEGGGGAAIGSLGVLGGDRKHFDVGASVSLVFVFWMRVVEVVVAASAHGSSNHAVAKEATPSKLSTAG